MRALAPGNMLLMLQLVLQFLITVVALGVADWLLVGVEAVTVQALIFAALVLAWVNTWVPKLLFTLTRRLNVVTLGFFYFLQNAVGIAITAALVPGFGIAAFRWAFVAAVIVTAVAWPLALVTRTKPVTGPV